MAVEKLSSVRQTVFSATQPLIRNESLLSIYLKPWRSGFHFFVLQEVDSNSQSKRKKASMQIITRPRINGSISRIICLRSWLIFADENSCLKYYLCEQQMGKKTCSNNQIHSQHVTCLWGEWGLSRSHAEPLVAEASRFSGDLHWNWKVVSTCCHRALKIPGVISDAGQANILRFIFFDLWFISC